MTLTQGSINGSPFDLYSAVTDALLSACYLYLRIIYCITFPISLWFSDASVVEAASYVC